MRATLGARVRIVMRFVVALSLVVMSTVVAAQADAQAPAAKPVTAAAPPTSAPVPSGIARALGELTPPIMAALLVLATLAFSIALFAEVSRGGSVAIESSWGGFGGSLGGWRLSTGLVYLLAVLFFGAMSMGVIQLVVRPASGATTREAPATAGNPALAPTPQAAPAADTTASAK
jgi:hypothetical protein